MLIQNRLYLILNLVGPLFSMNQAAHATTYQVYPSEYAYMKDDSITEHESNSAKCRRYPSGLQAGVYTELYTHCDGTQLKLIDSDLGQGEYQTTDYYMWLSGSDKQLLFIFPTRVSLTTITLHYYSDSGQSLPRLRFYAVPDDFDVWDAPTTITPPVDVASVSPGGEPAGRSSVSINVNFNTIKVLMYKYRSIVQFAVSEVEFFTYAVITTSTMTYNPTTSAQTKSDIRRTMFTESIRIDKDKTTETVLPNSNTGITAIGVSISILLLMSTILIIIVIVITWRYKRKSTKQKLYTDSPYSTLSRRIGQQTQPQSMQNHPAELYDQIHLSPSPPQFKLSLSPKANENTSEQPTYTAVDKTKKKFKRQTKKEDPQCKAAEKGSLVSPYRNETSSPHTIKDLYTAIKKKPKVCEPKGEEETPPIPPHTVEELYTAVQKKPKYRFNGDGYKDEAPPHIVDQMCEARGKPSQILHNTTEDLYTAVMKKPKDGSADDAEAAPPIPPHTVEELYTAVMKMSKGNTKNKKEAPPIPPYAVEEN